MRRSLALKRETLTDLTPAELTAVAGGSHTCPLTDTCADTLTHGPSIDADCPTLPVAICVTGHPSLDKLSARICP